MNKVTYKSNEMVVALENVTPELRDMVMQHMTGALRREWSEFIEEVMVEMRRLAPGESKTLASKPITVTIQRGVEEVA